jgi:hypothetical protein
MMEFLKKHDWLGHIVEALVMAAIVAALFFPFEGASALSLGLLFAAGHFHGREKRDYEVWAKLQAPHLKGYLIWLWNKDQLTDFIPVAVVMLLIYFGV